MIRSFGLFLMVAAALAMAVPVAAQTNVFVKKSGEETADESGSGAKPRGFFVPLKNMAGKVYDRYNGRSETSAITSGLTPEDLKDFDIDLLRHGGGQPKTVNDLKMIAAAHNASKNQALSQMRAEIQAQMLAQSAGKPVVSDAGGSQGGVSYATGGKIKSPTKVYVTPKAATDTEKKPVGVFTNY